MSRVAAVEYGFKNIQVNCIAPGTISTPLLLGQWGDEMLQLFAKLTARGKLGTPEELAQAALFLASDESSHITAQTLTVDGGMGADSHVRR